VEMSFISIHHCHWPVLNHQLFCITFKQLCESVGWTAGRRALLSLSLLAYLDIYSIYCIYSFPRLDHLVVPFGNSSRSVVHSLADRFFVGKSDPRCITDESFLP
jgi:hypothetical protein